MTDGPFRNAELPSRWKRYGQELVSDAASPEERTVHVCHSMIGDVDMTAFSPLFNELKTHAERAQLDLDPVTTVETIFETRCSRMRTPLLKVDCCRLRAAAARRKLPCPADARA